MEALAKNRKKQSFVALSAADRHAVIAESEAMQRSELRFLRNEALSLHYAHPAAWTPLRFRGAPQPDGYVDYALAPQ